MECKKYDARGICIDLLCYLPSDVLLVDKQKFKKCPEVGLLTLHMRLLTTSGHICLLSKLPLLDCECAKKEREYSIAPMKGDWVSQ